MAKAVFTTKPDSGYDDVREERYHFPRSYLSRVEQAVGDFIVYYEPGKGGGRASYIAVARIERIEPDPRRDGLYYARIVDYLHFDTPVAFRAGTEFFERSLRGQKDGSYSGAFQSAVRPLPEHEFEAIIAAGFMNSNVQPNEIRPGELDDEPREFRRPIIEQVVRKPFREAAFARQVKAAYQNQCAFTGLDMRNGGGRTEVDAAHIKPVGDGHNGSDSVRNGLALSKTVHWMFDRGLLSIDSDLTILMAKRLVPEPIQRLLNPSGIVQLPENPLNRPHPAFLDYHRNEIFKDAKAGV